MSIIQQLLFAHRTDVMIEHEDWEKNRERCSATKAALCLVSRKQVVLCGKSPNQGVMQLSDAGRRNPKDSLLTCHK